MSFFFRLLTVIELVLWFKKYKETRNGNVAQTTGRDANRVHDCDRPAGSAVLDDLQTEGQRRASHNQDTENGANPHQERNL